MSDRAARRHGRPRERRARKHITAAQLNLMVENTIMDAHDEAEQRLAFEAMLEEHLAVPFTTNVLGVSVVVQGLAHNNVEDVVAICRHGRHQQLISLIDLPRPSRPPAGWEWIEAYRLWARAWR